MMPPPKTNLSGFTDWLSFAKATLSLGATLTLGLWAILTWAMDDRYVLREDMQRFTEDIKQSIEDSARQIRCENLFDDIQRLEQTIAFKARSGEDASLERIILDSSKRRLDQLNGCRE